MGSKLDLKRSALLASGAGLFFRGAVPLESKHHLLDLVTRQRSFDIGQAEANNSADPEIRNCPSAHQVIN
jgi:hypothetical protein